jgi:hypothetical protein
MEGEELSLADAWVWEQAYQLWRRWKSGFLSLASCMVDVLEQYHGLVNGFSDAHSRAEEQEKGFEMLLPRSGTPTD